MAESILASARDLTKTYRRGVEEVHALNGVSFDVEAGEFVAITGASGSGKTTLLHLLGCMDAPTSGTLTINGRSTQGLADRELTRMRREQVGFVFQHFGLMPTLTVMENLTLPALFSKRDAKERAKLLLEQVGMTHRANHRPNQLSGGEMQRAAIARALINNPKMLLADEPTGNLDSVNGDAILQLFHQLNREGLTLIIVTHNPILAESAKRRMALQDGRIVS